MMAQGVYEQFGGAHVRTCELCVGHLYDGFE